MEHSEKVALTINRMKLFIADINTATIEWYSKLQKNDMYDYIEYIVKNNYIASDLQSSVEYIEDLVKADAEVNIPALCDEFINHNIKAHFRRLDYENIFNSTRAMDNLIKVWHMECDGKLRRIYDHIKQTYENDFEFTPTGLSFYYK